ncbi:MAG: hypothetical protein KH546_10135, partial [Clostridiales bacterium]|nr:hypothetical protein [Clostridiales bacterium]MEE0224467.1 hypothetical protein [Acutalibacteraceae bacterium]
MARLFAQATAGFAAPTTAKIPPGMNPGGIFLLPLGLTKPLVEPGVDKKALANKTSMLQSRW